MPGGGQEILENRLAQNAAVKAAQEAAAASGGQVANNLTPHHQFWTPEQALERVRASITSGDSGPGAALRAKALTVNSPPVQAALQKQNTHALRYRDDPVYKKQWDDSHGGSITDYIKAPLSHAEQAFNALSDNPLQALIGANTEAETDIFNSLLGTDFTPVASNTGGATDAQIRQMQDDGIVGADSVFNVADTAALMFGMSAANNALNQPGAATTSTPTTGGPANPTGSGFSGTGPGLETVGGANPSSVNAALGAGGAGALPAATDGDPSNNPNPSGGTPMANGDLVNNLLNLGGSLGSAYLTNKYSEKAIDELARQYDLTREDFAPWRNAGVNALGKLDNFDIESIRSDPMYQLANQEALRAVNRGNSARGLNLSGNALIDEARTAADVSSGYGNNIWNRYAGLAGVGQTAVGNTANAGQNAASGIANLYMQQGQGYNNALQGGLQNFFLQNYLNR